MSTGELVGSGRRIGLTGLPSHVSQPADDGLPPMEVGACPDSPFLPPLLPFPRVNFTSSRALTPCEIDTRGRLVGHVRERADRAELVQLIQLIQLIQLVQLIHESREAATGGDDPRILHSRDLEKVEQADANPVLARLVESRE